MGVGTGDWQDTIFVAPGAMSGSSCGRVLRTRRVGFMQRCGGPGYLMEGHAFAWRATVSQGGPRSVVAEIDAHRLRSS